MSALANSRPIAMLRHLPYRVERLLDIVRAFVVMISLLVILGSLALLALLIFDPNGSEEFTVGRRPAQYFQVFDNEERRFLDETYAEVLGIAHNSGGSVEATLEAILFGADVIEVDVVAVDGQLHAGHAPPLPYIGDRFFRGPPLERIWTASYRASALKLDLKETSPEYVELVAEFLATRPIERDVIVSSRSASVLAALRELAPEETTLLLSIPDEAAYERLQANPALERIVDGVTMRESLITTERALWLEEHDLRVFAWTVDDIERVNELVSFGVDGITSDNLAITSLLSEQNRD